MKSRHIRISILLAAFVCMGCLPIRNVANACTVMRFSFDGRIVVARNHDWFFGEGLLVVNPRGIQKQAISPVQPAKWVSTYGSVSFVQFGREIPFAGMNEKGLTVDLLQLDQAQFPVIQPGKHSVNVVQWVQYQLDTAATVADVVASLEKIYPTPMVPSIERVHYFVTDASGDVASIEFLGGKANVHRGNEIQDCALANSTCIDSRDAFRQQRWRNDSEHRYYQAVCQVQLANEDAATADPIQYARQSLSKVAQPGLTQWSIVYEPAKKRITFSTQTASNLRTLDLDDLDFDPASDALTVDVNKDVEGDLLPHLKKYSASDNARIVNFAFDQTMPKSFVRTAVKQLVLDYPATLSVVGESTAVGE
ncbi:linear amide C-N hydrolase [Novipirellula caenicola]|uniref:Choloylglycine hydrolase/NAAA C-terminal domain-containing protein n=1 Tax=Novipirellula caenicola TaxID=1536901 RepID=A0ABP9W362_9BACT